MSRNRASEPYDAASVSPADLEGDGDPFGVYDPGRGLTRYLPRLSAASITPPSNLRPSTLVPVTRGCLVMSELRNYTGTFTSPKLQLSMLPCPACTPFEPDSLSMCCRSGVVGRLGRELGVGHVEGSRLRQGLTPSCWVLLRISRDVGLKAQRRRDPDRPHMGGAEATPSPVKMAKGYSRGSCRFNTPRLR